MGAKDRANPMAQWRKSQGVTSNHAYDQFGREIGLGDFLILQAHPSVVWRVTNTKPILRPDMPPGLVDMTMAAVTQLPMQGGAPLPGVIKVRDALEYMTPEQLEEYTKEARAGGGPAPDPGVVPPPPRPEGEAPPAPDEPPAEPSRIILP